MFASPNGMEQVNREIMLMPPLNWKYLPNSNTPISYKAYHPISSIFQFSQSRDGQNF